MPPAPLRVASGGVDCSASGWALTVAAGADADGFGAAEPTAVASPCASTATVAVAPEVTTSTVAGWPAVVTLTAGESPIWVAVPLTRVGSSAEPFMLVTVAFSLVPPAPVPAGAGVGITTTVPAARVRATPSPACWAASVAGHPGHQDGGSAGQFQALRPEAVRTVTAVGPIALRVPATVAERVAGPTTAAEVPEAAVRNGPAAAPRSIPSRTRRVIAERAQPTPRCLEA